MTNGHIVVITHDPNSIQLVTEKPRKENIKMAQLIHEIVLSRDNRLMSILGRMMKV